MDFPRSTGTAPFLSTTRYTNTFSIRAGKVKMEPPGSRPHSQLIFSEVVTAEAETGEALHPSPGENVIRVRLADAVPMRVETTCLPQLLCANLLDEFDPRRSLYRTLLQVYGIHIGQANEVVGARYNRPAKANTLPR